MGLQLKSDFATDPVMAPLIDGFLAGLDARCAAIDRAIAAHDVGQATILAHKLVGAAASYGYPAIAAEAHAVESVAKAGTDGEALRARARSLTTLCLRASRR